MGLGARILDPVTRKRLRRFRRNRRAWISFLLVTALFTLSLGSEWLCNNVPFVVHYRGATYFPLFRFVPASTFGEDVATAPNYKKLKLSPAFQQSGNWMIFPPVAFGPNESVDALPTPPPSPPTATNWLGTDDRGRDLLTRLIYGFRNSMLFALVSWACIVVLAFSVGATQGYFGGRVDFIGQRLTEVWSSLPVLYVIIFLLSIFPSSLGLLTVAWVAFSWLNLASYIRAEVLRVRKQDYVMAAHALGVSTPRLLFRHILPNSLTPLLTFSPFIVSASVGSLAALDYLGLGRPPPTASWGELLRQGKENLTSWWLAFFPFFSLFGTLLLLNFIGEGVRSAFDAREA
jgi:microcin C transport system permease protein